MVGWGGLRIPYDSLLIKEWQKGKEKKKEEERRRRKKIKEEDKRRR
jgi:hypothetical protein